MASDLSVFGRLKSRADFDREAQEFELRRRLGEAEVRKASYLDADILGEQAFLKAAQGIELTPQEMAAARLVDAKSGGISLNPVTGEIVQKPRISEKIGLPEPMRPQGQPAPSPMPLPQQVNADSPAFNMPVQGGLQPFVDNIGVGMQMGQEPPIPMQPLSPMTPKASQKLAEENIKADRKRLDEVIVSADSASKARQAASKMANLQPSLGYTGFGGNVLGAVDYALTPFGAGGLIPGTPQAREEFQKEGVEAWVNAVEPLKGALTEREGARFDRAVPNLTTTPEGIRARARIAEVMAQRAQEKSQFYQDWFYQNGSLRGADQVWSQYASANPVITEEFLDQIGINETPGQTSAQPPRRGSVVDGYMFNGGDPADPKSWKKVR